MNPNKLKSRLAAPVGMAAAILCTGQAGAAAAFSENAGNSYYDSGWDFGSSQPDNFGWLTSIDTIEPGVADRFLGDSTNLAGGSGGDINTAGRSWVMFGQSGGEGGSGQANAFGFLKDGAGNDAALSVGQTLSVDIAVNFRNGFKGFVARDATDVELFTFNVGGDDYVVSNAATGNGSIGSDYSSNTVFRIALTQTSESGGTWTITRSGGLSDSDTGTYSGEVASFKLYVSQTDSGSENDLSVNNVSVTDTVADTPVITSVTRLENGSLQLDFTALTGGSYTVLANTDLDLPVSSWSELGTATETSPGSGQFQFTDLDAPNFSRRFYVVQTPQL
jgi:hypothetical protein